MIAASILIHSVSTIAQKCQTCNSNWKFIANQGTCLSSEQGSELCNKCTQQNSSVFLQTNVSNVMTCDCGSLPHKNVWITINARTDPSPPTKPVCNTLNSDDDLKFRIRVLLLETTDLICRLGDAVKYYCTNEDIQSDIKYYNFTSCEELASGLVSIPGMPLPHVRTIEVGDASEDTRTKISRVLNQVHLNMKDQGSLVTNVSRAELSCTCCLYDELNMTCPYRNAGLTDQGCRAANTQPAAQFYCSTRRLLYLVTRQMISHILQTEITLKGFSLPIIEWRPPAVAGSPDVLRQLTDRRFSLAAMTKMRNVSSYIKTKLQDLINIL